MGFCRIEPWIFIIPPAASQSDNLGIRKPKFMMFMQLIAYSLGLGVFVQKHFERLHKSSDAGVQTARASEVLLIGAAIVFMPSSSRSSSTGEDPSQPRWMKALLVAESCFLGLVGQRVRFLWTSHRPKP